MLTPHATRRSQRWRERRSHFVPNSTVIDPSEFSVDVIASAREAKSFVVEHHYSGTLPPTRLSVGLYRNGKGGRSELAGVACFTVPMNNHTVPLHTGLTSTQGLELGRFVLLDDVAANGETFLLSRAFSALRRHKPEVIGVVSFADPTPRVGPDGRTLLPGHCGLIYQAMGNSRYLGQRPGRLHLIAPNGQPFSERAASKIRNRERGHGYAVDQLVTLGATRPAPCEDLATWYAALLASGFFRRAKHPGNHCYAFALTRAARHASQQIPVRPLPRLDRHPGAGDVTALPLFGERSPPLTAL